VLTNKSLKNITLTELLFLLHLRPNKRRFLNKVTIFKQPHIHGGSSGDDLVGL
jgi:hypothetical protein